MGITVIIRSKWKNKNFEFDKITTKLTGIRSAYKTDCWTVILWSCEILWTWLYKQIHQCGPMSFFHDLPLYLSNDIFFHLLISFGQVSRFLVLRRRSFRLCYRLYCFFLVIICPYFIYSHYYSCFDHKTFCHYD